MPHKQLEFALPHSVRWDKTPLGQWSFVDNKLNEVNWQFAPWNEILDRAYREGWSGKQTSSTFRSVHNGWWADKDTEYGNTGKPIGGLVAQWLIDNYMFARCDDGPDIGKGGIPLPQYCEPHHGHGLVYMDVRAAYWSIYRHLTWDCTYEPGLWFGQGRKWLSEFPYSEHKLARNALIGIASAKTYVHWQNGNISKVEKKGGFYNPHLVGFVWSVLGAIAWKAVELGAQYWNVDGAILPAQNAKEFVDWGLQHNLVIRPKSKMGYGIVKAIGCYNLRGLKTGTWGYVYNEQPIVNLPDPDDAKLAFDAWYHWSSLNFRGGNGNTSAY